MMRDHVNIKRNIVDNLGRNIDLPIIETSHEMKTYNWWFTDLMALNKSSGKNYIFQ